MNKANYTKAKSYAYKVSRSNYMDVVHDAYLKWHKKTGKDLFDEDEGLVIFVVKNTIMTQNQKNYYTYHGVKYKKQFNEISHISNLDRKSSKDAMTYEPESPITPEDILIEKDLKEQFDKKISGKFKPYYNLLVNGYKGSEMLEELGGTQQLANWYIHQIRNKLNLN